MLAFIFNIIIFCLSLCLAFKIPDLFPILLSFHIAHNVIA